MVDFLEKVSKERAMAEIGSEPGEELVRSYRSTNPDLPYFFYDLAVVLTTFLDWRGARTAGRVLMSCSSIQPGVDVDAGLVWETVNGKKIITAVNSSEGFRPHVELDMAQAAKNLGVVGLTPFSCAYERDFAKRYGFPLIGGPTDDLAKNGDRLHRKTLLWPLQ